MSHELCVCVTWSDSCDDISYMGLYYESRTMYMSDSISYMWLYLLHVTQLWVTNYVYEWLHRIHGASPYMRLYYELRTMYIMTSFQTCDFISYMGLYYESRTMYMSDSISYMWIYLLHVTQLWVTNYVYEWLYLIHMTLSHTRDCMMSHELCAWVSLSHTCDSISRPTQSLMYVYCQCQISGIFFTRRSVQIQKVFFWIRCSRIWFSAQDYAVLVLLLNPVDFFISTRPKWSIGNVLYLLGISFRRTNRWGWPFKYFNMIHRVWRIRVTLLCVTNYDVVGHELYIFVSASQNVTLSHWCGSMKWL